MHFVQFNAPRVVTYTDPQAFDTRTRRWFSIREGENCHILGVLYDLAAAGPRPGLAFFTVDLDNEILAAGLLLPNHMLYMSWATHDVLETLVNQFCHAGWRIRHIHAPGHVAGFLGRSYAKRTGQRFELGRARRLYQLDRSYYALPSHGNLAVATPADRPMVQEWLEGFIEETAYEMGSRTLEGVVDALIVEHVLYFWKCPQPVSMAAWVTPTPHGAFLNFVYTLPEYRGQGYGKSICAALGAQMFASGLRYCFIFADAKDKRANSLCKSIGARTLCEFSRCLIFPEDNPTKTGLNVVRHSIP